MIFQQIKQKKMMLSSRSSMITVMVMVMVAVAMVHAVGRAPTSVEHNACRVKWAEHVNEVKRVYKDNGARVVAINKGLDGSPCMTSCRIIFRGNTKDMEDIFTPDDVQCAGGPHPRKGRCMLPVKFRLGNGAPNPDIHHDDEERRR